MTLKRAFLVSARRATPILCLGVLTLLYNSSMAAAQDYDQSTTSASENDARAYLTSAEQQLRGTFQGSLGDAIVTGTVMNAYDSPIRPNPFELRVNRHNYRLSFDDAGGTTQYSVRGDRGLFQRNGKIVSIPEFSTAGISSFLMPLLDSWTDLLDSGASIREQAPDVDQGEQCRNFELDGSHVETRSNLAKRYPQNSFLLIKVCGANREVRQLRLTASLNTNIAVPTEVRFRYENYAVMSGLKVPTLITKTVQGKIDVAFQISSVKLNQGLADGDFTLGGRQQ